MSKIVIRSRVEFLDMVGWEWHITSSPLRKGREVSRRAAREYIRAHGLVKAFSSEDGDIYDTPGGDFYNAFHEKVSRNEVSGGCTYTQRMDTAWRNF